MVDIPEPILEEVANEIRRCVELWCCDDTTGACYTASVALCLALAKHEVTTRLLRGEVMGKKHWWVETIDGFWIDVTADQFDTDVVAFPRVIISRPEEMPHHKAQARKCIDFEQILYISALK